LAENRQFVQAFMLVGAAEPLLDGDRRQPQTVFLLFALGGQHQAGHEAQALVDRSLAEQAPVDPQRRPGLALEGFGQQSLALGVGLPRDMAQRFADAVFAQAGEVVALDGAGRRLAVVLRDQRLLQPDLVIGARIHQYRQVEPEPAPGVEQPGRIAREQGDAGGPELAALPGRQPEPGGRAAAGLEPDVDRRLVLVLNSDRVTPGVVPVAQDEPEFAVLAAENRPRNLHLDAEAEQVPVRFPEADHAQRCEHEGQHVGHAVLVIDRREEQEQQHHREQVAEARRQDV